MAYEKRDVTAFSLDDITSGSIYRVTADSLAACDTLAEVATAKSGGTALGYLGPDGIDLEISVDDNDKLTHDRNLGKIYSNYLATFTLRFASTTDESVLETVFGDDNVSTGSDGTLKTALALQQPADIGLLILGKTDDGRKVVICINKGKVDPNLNPTLVNTDITLFEANVLSSSGDSWLLVEPVEEESI